MVRFKMSKADDLYTKIAVFIPKETFKKLQTIRDERRVPLSRLVARAVDNELDCQVPFNYDTTLPDTVIEYMYAAECKKVLDFLIKTNTGISIESLVIARRDLGIESRQSILAAIKELLTKGTIEEYQPRMALFRGEKRIRVVGADGKYRHNRIKTFEGRKI